MEDEDKNKIDKLLEFCEKYLTRLNVYLFLCFIALLSVFSDSLPVSEQVKNFINNIMVNKYWPVFVLAFEYFRKEVEKKLSNSYKSKLARIEAVVVSGRTLDAGYILAIIKGRDGELASHMTDAYVEARMNLDNPIE